MIRGRVVSLHRWPVKSLAGEAVEALVVDGRGVAGDRAHALTDIGRSDPAAPRLLTARTAPGMLRWSAAYPDEPSDPDDPSVPVLASPDGVAYAWDDPALPAALEADLGRPVGLRRDPRGQQDLPGTVLVTTGATHAALDATLGDLDLRRWRTNVHVELEDVPAFAEERWEAGTMRIGEARLDLLHPCLRCVIPTRDPETTVKRGEILRWLTRERAGMFGINARPTGRARIAVGDEVQVSPPRPD